MKPSPALLRLGRLFSHAGHRLCAVGGWVRDSLLGREPGDVDLTTSAPPDALEAMDLALTPRAAGLASYSLFWEGQYYELTCFRRDSYRMDGAHRPEKIQPSATLTEDALRRDFTVNALYLSLPEGELLDPLGALEHLRRRVLVTPREPLAVLTEDALRILRLARFAAGLDFAIDPALTAALPAALPGLARIQPARLGAELKRLLLLPRSVELLDSWGVWPWLFPHLTVKTDTFARLALPGDPEIRLAALLMGNHGVEADILRLDWGKAAALRVAGLLEEAHTPVEYRRLFTRVNGKAWALLHGRGEAYAHESLPPGPEALPVSGQELTALTGLTGPELGRLKRRLWQRVLENPSLNTHETLLNAAKEEHD